MKVLLARHRLFTITLIFFWGGCDINRIISYMMELEQNILIRFSEARI